MKIYTLKRKQLLNMSIEDAWAFFSDPHNLSKITPEYMNFRILSGFEEGGAYTGMIIQYKVSPVAGIPLHWVTEIKHLVDREFFVDEQRFGPYALWHHQHKFRQTEKGVEMEDIVNYAIPFGFLGRIANKLFVWRQVNAIFDYRYKVLDKLFNNKKPIAPNLELLVN